ncbi:MAG: CRISPR-associated protein [Leptospiraceae bacterium]|nr:MAG: CRISPR-associated protein [Leptospiraceae bacterium]
MGKNTNKKQIHIIIGTIGRGKKSQNNQNKGYEFTTYRFPDQREYSHTFFTISLYRYLYDSLNTKDLYTIIFGTNGSSWSELIQFSKKYNPEQIIKTNFIEDFFTKIFKIAKNKLNTTKEEILSCYEEIKEKSEKQEINKDLLEKWEKNLNEFLENKLFLALIDIKDNKWNNSLEHKIISELYEKIKTIINNYKKDDSKEKLLVNLHIDITHSYRIIPILLSFAIFPISLIQNIEFNIKFYYGAFELGNNQNFTPVIVSEVPQLMVDLYNGYSIYKEYGYFPEILKKICKIDANDDYLEDIHYKYEMNIFSLNSKEIDLINKLDLKSEYKENKIITDIYENNNNGLKITLENIKNSNKRNEPWKILLEKAKLSKQHKNYQMAIILLFESAMEKIKSECYKKSINSTIFNENYYNLIYYLANEKIKKKILHLKNFRNCVVHIDSNSKKGYLKNYDDLKKFEEEWEIFVKTIENGNFKVNLSPKNNLR